MIANQRLHAILLLLCSSLFLSTAFSSDRALVLESDIPKMPRILYEVDIDVPKDKAWELLADFTNFAWSVQVKEAQYIGDVRGGVGMARNCDLTNGGYVKERITHWDEGNSFTYVLYDSSNPVSPDSFAIWRVSGDESSSKVSFEGYYDIKYGILGNLMNALFIKRQFTKQVAGFMTELKTYLETT